MPVRYRVHGDSRGTALIQSYFDRWNAFFELIHAINSVFREAWNENGVVVRIFGAILGVIISVIKGFAWALKGISDWISEHQTLVQDFPIIIVSIGTALAISGVVIQTVRFTLTLTGVKSDILRLRR